MSEQQHPLNALPKGHRLQEYELVRVLGFGGFGMTYLGFDHNLDKAVAIKEYLPSDIAIRTADRSVAPQASAFRGDFQWGLERFLDEARTLARFDHRHIIKVYRFFEAHGTAYIVMEYAEGETLSAFLTRQGPLSEAELKAILYPLLDGLAVVHEADFLHRDIKPGNIVLRDADGSPVLLDFGAARQAIGAKSRSVTSIVTPGYAPIEQYSSRGRQGAWTDLYALGGVCYRALTGQVPEDATDRVRHDPLVPVAQRCAGRASGAFLSAIDWALSVDEGDRPQRVGAWREAMEADAARAEKDEGDDATSMGRVEPEASPLERPKTSFKRFAVVLGVAALLFGGIMYVDHAEQVALEKQRQEQAVEKARLAAEQAEQQRREQAALEKQRREQAALEKQRQEQAALEKQRREQAALEQQRREEQAVLNKAGVYSLHDAASKNAYEAAEVLLKQGADANAKTNTGSTPLHWAAKYDASATAAVLLDNGADVNAKNNYAHQMPLHWAAKYDASATAAVLLDNGADVNAKDNYGQMPLHWAVREDASAVAAVLLDNGADVNAKDNTGQTPLHRAAYRDASAAAAVLLKQGADIHAKDNKGNTPLHRAVREDASAVAAVLLKQGADIHAKDNKGNTPLHRAAVLFKQGAKVNAKDNKGWTPLHRAVREDASAVAAVLLKQGADVHAKTNYGNTPLHVAAYKDASATAQVLLDNGAEVNAKDNYGNTPLHVAAREDASATAQVLLDNGAEVNAKNNTGWTPLHRARGASATAAMLRRYGARR